MKDTEKKEDGFSEIQALSREVGRYGVEGGPALVITAGLHGNEKSGIAALERVFTYLQSKKVSADGMLYGIRGNLRALERGVRYIDEDLNRAWKHPGTYSESENSEGREIKELKRIFNEILSSAKGPVYFMDLHTTSSDSAPFLVLGDTIRVRKFVRKIPVSRIFGIEDQLEGTLASYISDIGNIFVNFEAGQHNAKSSIDLHESAIWMVLWMSAIFNFAELQPIEPHQRRLARASSSLPRVFESRFRYDIKGDEKFKMLPGFENFQIIHKGTLLGKSSLYGNIRAHETGRIFMPKYQKQGNDGYFIIQKIPWLWLRVSRILRILRLDRSIGILPGVQKHPSINDTYVVNTRLAPFKTMSVLRLLGYRKVRWVNNLLFVSRRKFDN